MNEERRVKCLHFRGLCTHRECLDYDPQAEPRP